MVDLHSLQEKFPNHHITHDSNTIYCDGKKILTVPSEAALDKQKINIENIIEMQIRLLDDPHWYDYERVQERLKNETTRSYSANV
jgi:hypothetical protein